MDYLIRKIKIIDKKSPYNNLVMDILIVNNIITKIEDNIEYESSKTKIIELDNACISVGWVDSFVNLKEPGEEWVENIKNGVEVAKKSGFTKIILSPDTIEKIDSRSKYEFISNKNYNDIELIQLGSITCQNSDNLSAMYEMNLAGCKAFCDDTKYVSQSVMNKAMQYTSSFDTFLVSCPYSMTENGQINEGFASLNTGLKSIPHIYEKLIVHRDIELAKYNNSKLHINNISTIDSIEIIQNCSFNKITSSVSINSLYFDESEIMNFDTNYKLLPTLKDIDTQQFLIQSLIDKKIDIVNSHHIPVEIDNKNLEFDNAKFGSIGMESFFGALNYILNDKMNLEDIIELITDNPRKIFNLEENTININEKANLTLFDSNIEWTFKEEDIFSNTINSVFIEKKLKGKAIFTIL